MTCGIYKLNFIGTSKIYIGKSKTLETRLRSHIISIRNNKGAIKLTDAFKTYGIPTLEIILECDENDLNKYETEAIEIFDAVNNGFNTLNTSDEMPDPDNSGEHNGMSKLSNENIISIFKYLVNNKYARLHEVATLFNVSYNIVNAMASCTNHKWLKDQFPDEYKQLESYKGRNNGKSASERGIVYPPIISPEGVVYVVNNINKFAKEHGLDRGSINKLLNYKAKSHKGWKLA